jgi:hypothetical protein
MAANQDFNLGSTVPTGSAPAGSAAKSETPPPVLRYVDRPDCQETFADSIAQVMFDGQSLRLEFCVTRLDEVKPNTQVTGRRLPAARMVLTPMAAVELINRLHQVAAAMTQAGMLKANPPNPPKS